MPIRRDRQEQHVCARTHSRVTRLASVVVARQRGHCNHARKRAWTEWMSLTAIPRRTARRGTTWQL